METVTLIKDYKKRQFSPKAAKIAIEHFGWSEIIASDKPSEVGTKTKPPIIDKPVVLKTIPIEKKVEVNDDLAESQKEFDAEIEAINKPDTVKEPEVKSDPVVKEKTKRKSPVKSKSKAK